MTRRYQDVLCTVRMRGDAVAARAARGWVTLTTTQLERATQLWMRSKALTGLVCTIPTALGYIRLSYECCEWLWAPVRR